MDQSGLCAAWLFENHRQFAARATYAQKQIERLPEIIQQRKDEAILSMSLARPEIGSLPKGLSQWQLYRACSHLLGKECYTRC